MSTRAQVAMKTEAAPVPSAKPASAATLRRKCACGASGGSGGECTECAKKKLQRRAFGAGPEMAPPIVHEVLRSPGQPLGAAARAYFEPRFGHDFGKVRVHTDARANESARSVNALAYTVGQQIVFGEGSYRPQLESGRRLLAHELTHVTQHDGSVPPSSLAVAGPAGPAEQEAHRVANAISWANPAVRSAPGTATLQRQQAASAAGTQGPEGTSAASKGVGSSLCSEHPDELYYKKNPGYCQDTPSSGSLHKGFRCYREIPGGSGCPAGKHVCFDPTTGKCDPGQSHIDATAPSISRDPAGMCNLSWLGWCSIEHFITDVIPDLLAEGEKTKIDCIENCQKTQPLWSQGFCMQGCTGGGAF
jgi:hypothetical protein